MNIRHSVLGTALALALVAPSAHALGLGQLQVKSGLNQPLVAEIPIISATPGELEALDVRLASPEAFARVGLDRPLELTANLQFSVGKNSRGQPVVRVTTANKFTEPFLSFLLEADWGKGAVTREYTALIDPPYIAPAIVRPMATPSVAVAPPSAPEPAPAAAPTPAAPPPAAETAPANEPEPASVAPVPAPPPVPAVAAAPTPKPAAPRPAPATPKPAPRPAPPAPAPTAAAGQVGPVANGQTLWSIASTVRPDDSVTMSQMMLALLHANPDAFTGDNINNLKRGAVLRIPSKDEITALSAAQAAELVHAQASAWRNSRKPVPQPAEAVSDKSKPASSAASRPVASAGPAKSGKARLEIVPPSGKQAASGAQSGAAAGAGGTELRAELTQAREDLAARTAEVGELKSRVADLEQINDKQQKMIQVQDSQMKALQDRIKQLETQQSAQAAAPAAAPAPAPAATVATAASEPVAEKSAAKPAATSAAPAVESSPWFLDPYVLGGGALVVLGGLVALMRRSRRKGDVEAASPPPAGRRISDDDALHASLAKNQSKKPAAEPATPAPAAKPAPVAEPAPAKTEPTASMPAAAPAAASSTEPSELDGLQATLRARPQDLEAHLNLLRYFHKRGDASAYETAAQVMRLQVPSVMDPRWREAAVMGSALLPGHPLFSQASWNAPRFSEPEPAAAPAPAASAPEALMDVAPTPAESIAESSESFGEALVNEPVPELSFEPVLEDEAPSALDFDMPTGDDPHRQEAELMAQDEASATKIELAKAYLDIGDFDGARSMLEEVLAEGSALAKTEAARILKEIG